MTLRLRLTLVYGSLFLLAGMLLLGVTYILVSVQLPGGAGSKSLIAGNPPAAASRPNPSGTQAPTVTNLTPDDGAAVQKVSSDARAALLTQGAIALGVVGAISVGFGWLIAGRLLQPLQRVTETARRIADAPAATDGLHERIALAGPQDEVKILADTFDVMLERLDRSFDSQRRFIANASHELRTPLTLNRALVEVAVRRSASPELRQLGETLLEVNARNEHLIEGLLLLARSEGSQIERSYVDLADIVEHVASVGVITSLDEAPTSGNAVLLERLVSNLIENGLRYNLPEGGWVRVRTWSLGAAALLEVSNTGPVVPRYEVAALFEPFRRLGADRVGAPSGAGLGLSIVRAVATAHGGAVDAEPRTGGGLIVTVRLPVSP